MKLKTFGACLGAVAIAVGMSACSNGNNPEKQSAGDGTMDGKPTVYASTDVWAAVAQEVVGDKAKVITSIDQPNMDPHSYEATVKDKQLVSQAAVVIVNGGGYDDWALQLAQSADNQPKILNAVELAGIECGDGKHEHEGGEHEHEGGEHEHEDAEHEHEDAEHEHEDADHEHGHEGHHHCAVNEHVFYDLDTADKVAQAVAATLSQTDATNTAAYQEGAATFSAGIDELKTQAESIKARGEKHSLATEPLANYLLEAAGVHDITPEDYVEQSETESGPSVKIQAETKALITDKKIDVLLVNSQTEDPVSKALQDEAKQQGIPLVTLTETLAGAGSYLSWISNSLEQLDQALS